MYLWRTGGFRNRGTKKLVDNRPYRITFDKVNRLARCRVRGQGSNPDKNTAYDYSIAFDLDELLRFLDELTKNFPDSRETRRLIRKYRVALGKLVTCILEHKD